MQKNLGPKSKNSALIVIDRLFTLVDAMVKHAHAMHLVERVQKAEVGAAASWRYRQQGPYKWRSGQDAIQ